MVHTFEALGVKLAVDVNSGAVHVLDDLTYRLLPLVEPPMAEHCPPELLARLPEYRTEAVEEGWQDLRELAGNGLLFVEDDYVDPAAATALQQSAPIKALCLHVSHDCNLRCQYCFASTGDFGTGRKIMDIETAKRAIDFVIQRSGSRRNIEVDFFGGEPLMAMDTVKATVAYARSIEKKAGKCFRFTITTNGFLLDDENIDYINREMSNAVLSLDGRPQVNDRMRKTVNGKGSYEVIVPKFQKLVAGRGTKDYYLRGTFTHYNLDFAEDVMHMADLGFRNVSVEPVVGEETCGYALKDEDLPVVLEQYEKLAEKLKDRTDVNFFHFNVDLAQGPCVIKRLRGCGAGCEYVAVTPEGDIYPCHQFVGIEQWKMGNLYDGTFNDDIKTYFSKVHVYSKEGCRSCWAKFFCSGGCNANSFIYEGDVKKPYKIACEMQKKRLECAIALAADRAVKGHEAPSMSEAPASMG